MEHVEDIPHADRVQIWFLNDVASAHYCRDLMNHLNNTFGKRQIGRNGPVKWPPRIPQKSLTILNRTKVFVNVFTTNVTVNKLKTYIIEVFLQMIKYQNC